MVSHSEAVPPLHIEQALHETTIQHPRNGEVSLIDSVKPPAALGSLALGDVVHERIRFDPVYDADRIADSARKDLMASYEIKDPATALQVRQRSLAWLDWLAQETSLDIRHKDYSMLANTAVAQGDVKTVRQIVEDPKRFWLDDHAAVPSGVRNPGLHYASTSALSSSIADIAQLMARAPDYIAPQLRVVLAPTLYKAVGEVGRRDVLHHASSIETACKDLLTVGTSPSIEFASKLVAALPMTSAKVDILVGLAMRNERFAAAARKAEDWHRDKTAQAERVLTGHLKQYGITGRSVIDYPVDRTGKPDMAASQPIAAAIADQIPRNNHGVSGIETSVAFATNNALGGSIHGDILSCVRTIMGQPQFTFAKPRFGFAPQQEVGYHNPQSSVKIIDANLPHGWLIVDLSTESFGRNMAYDDLRFLCGLMHTEKLVHSSNTIGGT